MKKKISIYLFLMSVIGQLLAQIPQVPSKIPFAGMSLELNKAAQKKVQEEVDKLCKNPTYFQKYVGLADIYFPVIENVFQEQKFPDEIKYLVIQESAFRSDAVSSSNAVGYWQFKKETGIEVGLKIEGDIDERKNIERASRGAAIYMTKNNTKLNNWVHALTSYNTGLGGVQKYVDSGDIGAKKMEITARTHWYFLTFLAHKIAFEGAIGKVKPTISLVVDTKQGGKKLKQIAKEYNISLEDLIFYNKWIGENDKIPTEGTYSVIIPVGYTNQPLANKHKSKKHESFENEIVMINGVEGLIAVEGDNADRLAIKAKITRKQFLVYNEMKNFEEVVVGEIYFVHAKKHKASVPKHIVQEGETLAEIAKKYAIKQSSIRHKNRMRSNEALMKGRVLWLREKRDKDTPIEYEKGKNEPVKVVKKDKPAEKITEINENEVIDEIEEKPVVKETPKKEEVKKEEIKKEEVKKEEVYVQKKTTTTTTTAGEKQQGVEEKTTIIRQPDKLVIKIQEQGQQKPTKNSVIHVVAAGETLYSISKLYKVTVSEIIEWNNLSNPALSLGQKLVINNQENVAKSTTEEAPKYVYHIVQKGDTIFGISKQYKITPAQILEWNKKTEATVSIGEKLIVKILE